jgi:hypothetical protein
LEESYNTVWSCGYERDEHLVVIPVQKIISVVAMVPHLVTLDLGGEEEQSLSYFLVEKPGLDMIDFAGYQEVDNEAEE